MPAMVLSLFLLLAPAPVHAADPLDDFIGFLQDVEGQIGPLKQYGFPVSAQELANSKDAIQCLIDANGGLSATAVCADKMENLPDEMDMFVDSYIYWMNGDYLGLAWYVGGDFVCAFLDNFLTGGYMDVCGLLEDIAALAEGVYDAGKALVEFFGEIGEAFWDGLKGLGCDTLHWGCDDPPPIPQNLTLFHLLQRYAPEGVEKREAVDSHAFDNYLADLTTRVLAEANKPLEKFNASEHGMAPDFPLFTAAAMELAAKDYTTLVNGGWTDDVLYRDNKSRRQRVDLFAYVAELFVQQVAENCAAGTTCEAVYTFNDMCTESINIQQKFAHIDQWKITPITTDKGKNIQSLQQGIKTTSQVCQSFFNNHQKLYQEKAREYIVQQKICTESGSSLFCGDLEKYATCDKLMSAFGVQDGCSVNLKAAADEARAMMMARFREEGSRFYPLQLQTSDTTITKKPQGGSSLFVPKEFPCYRPTHTYFFEQFYNELFGDLSQQVLRAVSKEDAAYTALREIVKNTVTQLGNNPDYAQCDFMISPIDPLLVSASSTYCLSLVQENNDAPGFTFSTSVPKPLLIIDGQDNPLMFSDHAGELEKRFKKIRPPELVNQKIDITASMKQNPVAEKLNPAAKFVPAAQLSGESTAVVSPGRQLQTPTAGQRVMSGTLPGQQVAGTSFPSGIETNKSPSVLKKKDGGMHKKAAMEVLPINRRNKTSRPVTIRIKNVPFSRIPFELRYRPGTGGFYKPVQRPVHRFNRTNGLTTLTLSLKQAGQYQIRFRSSGRGAWGRWTGFTVTENIGHAVALSHQLQMKPAASKMINPQPEPPGKTRQKHITGHAGNIRPTTSVRLQPSDHIKPAPPTIKTPRNGQKFMLTGRNLHVKAEISHMPGQKVQVAVERETRGRFTALTSSIRTHRMQTSTRVDILVTSAGKYRLRVKGTGKNGRWGRWTTFTVDTLMKNPPKLHAVKPTVKTTNHPAQSGTSPATEIRPHLQLIK